MSITSHTLMLAVKATAEKVQSLAAESESAEDPELSYLEEELSAYSCALAELKTIYSDMQSSSQNLPLYEELVPKEDGKKFR